MRDKRDIEIDKVTDEYEKKTAEIKNEILELQRKNNNNNKAIIFGCGTILTAVIAWIAMIFGAPTQFLVAMVIAMLSTMSVSAVFSIKGLARDKQELFLQEKLTKCWDEYCDKLDKINHIDKKEIVAENSKSTQKTKEKLFEQDTKEDVNGNNFDSFTF